MSRGTGHGCALPGGHGTGELGFGARAQLGQPVHAALPRGSLWGGQPGTRLLCGQLLRVTHTNCFPCPASRTHGYPCQGWWPCWRATDAGLEGAGLHLLQTLTLLPLLLFSSSIYPPPPALVPGWWAPLVPQKARWGLRELQPCSTFHSLDSPLQGLPLLAPPVAAVLLASACLARPGGQRLGSGKDEAPQAGQQPVTHAWLPQGSPECPWDQPQKMPPPITTSLPALGKRRGKKGRSSPRQVLPGAVVLEGAAGTVGMRGCLGREGCKRWW